MTLNQIDEKKQIGSYTLKLNTEFNKDNGELIFLNIGISNDFQKLLKEITLDETSEVYIEDLKLKRYLVFRPFYGLIDGDYKDILFLKELINNKKAKIGFNTVRNIEKAIEQAKENSRVIIRNFLKINNLSVTVNYEQK